MSRAHRVVIGVMGGAACSAETAALAYAVGKRIAERGAVLLTGGRTGVMEEASRGAHDEGGLVIGVLPGRDATETPPNPFVDVALFTGLGDARNYVNVCSSDALIALDGEWGTLSEIALAKKNGKPVVVLGAFPGLSGLSDVERAVNADDAVSRALALVNG
jgi:uncharacterized protein (TIGR00725 family)